MPNKKSTDIVIIKGAPGSGKSEAAKCLSELLKRIFKTEKCIKIEIDTLRSMVIPVEWKNQEEHIKLISISADLIYSFFKFGFKPIIVVDTFSGDKIQNFINLLYNTDADFSIKIFSLYLSSFELKRRLENRPADKFRNFEISKKINDDTLKFHDDGEILIDTTYLNVNETANIILENT
jgi:energy-coupling factor transporter ATP-binding protein EcfA2